jgi:ferritin-like metal-binding protein YciE
MNDLEKLFLSELKDIYDGEQRLVKALPELADDAESDPLKRAFTEHFEQTKNHVNRLEEVFRAIGQEPRRKTCKGIEGIVDEGEMIAKEFEGNTALDAALITAGQKAEHYEITSYGSLCTWAHHLGRDQVASLLEANLKEEKEADQKLTRLATAASNVEAMRHDTEKKSEAAATVSKIVSSGP